MLTNRLISPDRSARTILFFRQRYSYSTIRNLFSPLHPFLLSSPRRTLSRITPVPSTSIPFPHPYRFHLILVYSAHNHSNSSSLPPLFEPNHLVNRFINVHFPLDPDPSPRLHRMGIMGRIPTERSGGCDGWNHHWWCIVQWFIHDLTFFMGSCRSCTFYLPSLLVDGLLISCEWSLVRSESPNTHSRRALRRPLHSHRSTSHSFFPNRRCSHRQCFCGSDLG